MSHLLSETFKTLRRRLNLTQEQVAEVLGVSCQAVSKWETGFSCPDISLLPGIADLFGVSVDHLLGHDTCKLKEEIQAVCREATALFDKDCHSEAVPLLREALIRHPGNEELMYALAWALSGTLRESPENYEEAILLYHKILEISTDTAMRTKVTRDLMYRYVTKEDYPKAWELGEALPPFDCCQEYNTVRGNLYAGEAMAVRLRANIRLFGEAMAECLEYFVGERILTQEEKAPYTAEIAKKDLALLRKLIKHTESK